MSSTYGIDGFELEDKLSSSASSSSGFPLDIGNLVLLGTSIAITLYIVIINLFVIICILKEAKMRRVFFFRHILFIAIAHLLQGALVIPLHIESYFRGRSSWIYNPYICVAWYLTDLCLLVVLTYLFLMLMFERFFSLTYPQVMSSSCLGWLMIISPWLLSAGFVLFLYFTAPFSIIHIVTRKAIDVCTLPMLVLDIYSCIGFLLPATFVFGFCWANCLVRCLLRLRYVHERAGEDPRVHTTTSSVVALCFIFMCLPSNSKLLLPSELHYLAWTTISVYLAFANAALTPTLWLMIPSFRRNCCPCCKPKPGHRHVSGSRSVDEIHARMLEPEATQPSATTKL